MKPQTATHATKARSPSPIKTPHEFVITLIESQKKQSRTLQTLIWDSHQPLTLGHPPKWSLQVYNQTILIRFLQAPRNVVVKKTHIEIALKDLLTKQTIELPSLSEDPESSDTPKSYTLQIYPAQPIAPIYEIKNHEAPAEHCELRMFACVGDWILSSTSVQEATEAYALNNKLPAFLIKSSGSRIKIRILQSGLRLQRDSQQTSVELEVKKDYEFSPEEMSLIQLTWSGESISTHWVFNLVDKPKTILAGQKTQDADSIWFKKSLTGVAAALLVLLTTVMFLPKPEVEEKELIPPQFAKIVMSKPKSTMQAAAPTEAAPSATSAAKPTQAVAQAFRAKALQSSISKLLKGGMSNLLAQSNLMASKSTVFFSQSKEATALGDLSKLTQGKAADVKAIGGKDGAQGAGYEAGKVATVGGQGSAFVDLDAFGSDVAQGLTKDEVGKVIHAHLSEVRYCYESAMLRNPDVEGKLIVNFSIAGNGFVSRSNVKQSTLPDAQLDDCILRRLGKWEFPKPKGGVTVAVTYPFIFKTLGR